MLKTINFTGQIFFDITQYSEYCVAGQVHTRHYIHIDY